ncbi:hypothetical protein AVDCRST_MAG92-1239, partial [uncultured Coleofasciculus sp.]
GKKKRATCVTLPVIRVHLLVLSINDWGEGCHPLSKSFSKGFESILTKKGESLA